MVLATGGCQAPDVPAFADRLAPSVLQLHSTEYRGPSQLQPGDALVVGLGNSGAEIALEISRTRRPSPAPPPARSPSVTDESPRASPFPWCGSSGCAC